MSNDPDETRTTLRPDATRMQPLPAKSTAGDPEGTRTTLKRDGEAPPDASESELAQGARTTLQRDAGAADAEPHSEARSTRILLGQVATPTLDLAPGRVIKQRFEIVEELGRGGMGVVYKARDLRKVEAHDPDPYIAIKVLTGDMADFDLGFIALQREGKHAQALNHPNLVKVFDFDCDGNLVFLTMELLKGESLQSRLRDDRARPMSSQARLRIARGIIAGLAYAHARKIVHADIKPSNVFLCEDGEPKILDFGIARAAERDAVFDADDIGALTVDYASVEMLAGERPQPADDVYALGCLLFRLYAGQHPFQHRPADLAQADGLKPALPKSLTRMQARAVAKAIAFTRAERPVDASALGRAFEAYDWLRFARNSTLVLALAGAGLWWSHAWLLSHWSAWRLTPSERSQVETALDDARGNLEKSYWEDAAARYVDALRVDPYNRVARAGVVDVVAHMQAALANEEDIDALLILRERTQCEQTDAACPIWVRELLSPSAAARTTRP